MTHEFKRARFMECHFPAVGLLPWEGAQDADHSSVSVIGINPPETISPLEVLIQGESKRGIGLWRQDLYGVGVELAGKRNQRGWDPGMKDIFVDKGLEEVVEQLVCWDGGQCNAWFSRMEELPWHYRAPVG